MAGKRIFYLDGGKKGDVAALITSHVFGLQPFYKTIKQTTE